MRSKLFEEPTATRVQPITSVGDIATDGTRGLRWLQESSILPDVLPQPWLDVVFIAIGYLAGSLPMGVLVSPVRSP